MGKISGIHHISMKCGQKSDFERVKAFYIDLLGFSIVREWPEGVMLYTGNVMLEIFCNGEGIRSKGAIRHVAFGTDDVDGMIETVRNAGYRILIEPKDIVIRSDPEHHARMAFCYGPLGEEIEFFRDQ